MADSVNIGGEEDGYAMTWGKLRTAMFKATGYRDTYPRNKNWNGWQRFFDGQIIESNSAGYMEVLGDDLPLIKSTPYGFKWPNFPPTYTVFPNTSGPLCVGANYNYDIETNPSLPNWRKYTYYFYFAIGDGLIETYSAPNPPYQELVFPNQPIYSFPSANKPAYDINITKEKYVEAVINLSLNLPNGSSSLFDVTITEDCFPDNPYSEPGYGKLFHTAVYEFLIPDSPIVPEWDRMFFTINSITMPS